MTPSEFKAWFDGFTEAFEGRVPTKAQWSRVKDRVAEIDGKPVTERIYVDRYWHQYWSQPSVPYYSPAVWCSVSTSAGNATSNDLSGGTCTNAVTFGGTETGFNSHLAMSALGRADALALGAA